MLSRIAAFGGGLAFLASLLGFVWALLPGGWLNRDAGPWTTMGIAPLAWNAGLFSVFALHHSVFARFGVKQWVTRHLPPDLERTAYVTVASLFFTATYLLWREVPGVLWRANQVGQAAAIALQLAGGGIILAAVRRLDLWGLAGVRRAETAGQPALVAGALYGLVRHPIYLGWLLLVWSSAPMTATRLAFAALSTAYLVIAIPLEERGLRVTFGPAYDEYRGRVRWRLLPGVY